MRLVYIKQDPGCQIEDETDAPDLDPDDESPPRNARPSHSEVLVSSKHAGINLQSLGWVKKLHAPSEKDWTAAMKTSVDWKSLTIPACLPLTTDYHPDQRLLDNRYFIYPNNMSLGVDEA